MDIEKNLQTVNELIKNADAVLVGAGAGMSIPAGIDLTNKEAFAKAYPAMLQYGFTYGYQLLGYPYPDDKLRWGYLSNSLMDSARLGEDETYQNLKKLLEDKEHFILTTNVDRLFYKNGFDADKIYTPQGDSFLFQCKLPCTDETWDALPLLEEMEKHIDKKTQFLTDDKYVPRCPHCGGAVYMNVRSGNFYLHKNYDKQREKMNQWLETYSEKNLVLLEIGVGFNTPGVIRMPFDDWSRNENITLIRINPDEFDVPKDGVSLPLGAYEAFKKLTEEK